ncbi:MAG: DUF348 domain-containing protein [Chloroflexi bacterium]|nr:DUF348 domain-containing protein [Chloroflexota bacterium]
MRNWLILLVLSLSACAPLAYEAATVTLQVDGETRTLTTDALTVRDVLKEAGITLGEYDRVAPVEPTFVQDRMSIRVTRVEIRSETVLEELPFERRTVRDTSIPVGETRLLDPGITGSQELTYRIALEDGIETERSLIRRVTVQEPRTEVILIGAQAEIKPIPITGTVAFLADRNVWTMRGTSANQQRLTSAGDLDGRVFSLAPDGTTVLFTRIPTETGASRPLNTLWIVETALPNPEPTRIDADGLLWAEWEPDCVVRSNGTGCRIAYSTGVPTDGSPGWRANNDLRVGRPTPSDGRLLGDRQIVAPGVGGTYGWWGSNYSWSPDGTALAFGRPDQIGVVTVAAGAASTLTEFPVYRTYGPWVWVPTVSWSPEGQLIVTTLHGPAPTGETPEDSPVFNVCVLSADGALTAELSSEAGMWAAPNFSPDSDLVAYGRARSPYLSQTSTYDLYVMDRDGSDRRLLFPTPDESGLDYPYVAWGPGGRELIVIYRGKLYLITTQDDEVHQLTAEGNVTAVQWRW